MKRQTLSEILGIDYPLIVAPMFLISNTAMVKAALDAGCTAAFPALNYRTDRELRDAIKEIKAHSNRPFGVNLIVNKSNPRYKGQLDILVELGVDFIITSLGNPKETIVRCKPKGIKVFCDVVDLEYARKVESLGADGIIAVNNEAGGHAGHIAPRELIETLTRECSIPVIAAGGIATGQHLKHVMDWGAAGASVGTIFIACSEAEISAEYKQAMIDYGAKDIVRTNKLSGSPLTVINTPYVQSLGTKANFLELILNRSKTLKKWAKMILAFKGMKAVERAAFSATYKTVWCAGPAIEYVKAVRPMKEILGKLIGEYTAARASTVDTIQ